MIQALFPGDEKWSMSRTLAYIASYNAAAWTLLGLMITLMAALWLRFS